MNYWLYEADLKLLWTNVEDSQDFKEIKIHAIGTNEMPDKAKGSAFTYALKYYFFNKFTIDQGGDDPDMQQENYDEQEGDGANYEDKKEEAAKTQAPPPSRNIKPESGTPVQLPENARKAQQEEKRTVQPTPDASASGMFTVEDAKKWSVTLAWQTGDGRWERLRLTGQKESMICSGWHTNTRVQTIPSGRLQEFY